MRLFERSNDERFVDVVTRLRAKILPGTPFRTLHVLVSYNGEETTTELLDWYAANKKGSMNTDLCGKYTEQVIMPIARHLNPGMANDGMLHTRDPFVSGDFDSRKYSLARGLKSLQFECPGETGVSQRGCRTG